MCVFIKKNNDPIINKQKMIFCVAFSNNRYNQNTKYLPNTSVVTQGMKGLPPSDYGQLDNASRDVRSVAAAYFKSYPTPLNFTIKQGVVFALFILLTVLTLSWIR